MVMIAFIVGTGCSFSVITRSILKMEFVHLNIEKYLESFSEKSLFHNFDIV